MPSAVRSNTWVSLPPMPLTPSSASAASATSPSAPIASAVDWPADALALPLVAAADTVAFPPDWVARASTKPPTGPATSPTPTAHPLPLVNVLRDDVVAPCLDRDEVLGQAPATEHGLFRVPRILGEAP